MGQGNVFRGVYLSTGVGLGLCRGGRGEKSLSTGGSLSKEVSVWRVLVQGVSVQGVSVSGVSVQGGLCQGDPLTVMSRRYISYCNAFLFTILFCFLTPPTMLDTNQAYWLIGALIIASNDTL